MTSRACKRVLPVAAAMTMSILAAGTPAAHGAAPSVSAPAAVVIQPATGDVVYQRRATQRRSIASTTKLMTALLALERRPLSQKITAAAYRAAPAESVAGLRAGERLTTADLLRALLLASANDAAATIAADIGGSQAGFVRLMNARARSAGLTSTRFANPVGLDDRLNYSSATDLAKLALLVRANPFARALVDRPSALMRSGARPRVVNNRNTLIGSVSWMNGVKTGHTRRAGYVLVGSASRDGVELVSVVMGTSSEGARNTDTLRLMDYGFSRYERVAPQLGVRGGRVAAGRAVAVLPVKHAGDEHKVRVVPGRDVRVVVRRGEPAVATATGLPRELEGPLAARTRVGTLLVRRRGKVIDRVPLVTARSIARASWVARNGSVVRLAVLLAGAGLAAASLNRGRRRRRERSGRRPRSETA